MVSIPTLHQVEAITYLQQKEHSKTRPSVFECQTSTGERQTFIVKSRPQLKECILCEAFAAQLGHVLELPIPECAAVIIPNALMQTIPERDQDVVFLLENDEGPHFGSAYLTGGFTVPPAKFAFPDTLDLLALKIFVFDMLIQNRDRCYSESCGKPNILYDGENLYLIDHEASFNFIYGEPPPTPWSFLGQTWVRKHLFYGPLKHYVNVQGKEMEFILKTHITPMLHGLRNLSIIEASIPNVWKDTSALAKIMVHLKRILDNWDQFVRGIWEVLI